MKPAALCGLAVVALANTALATTFAFSYDFPSSGPGGYTDSGSGTLTTTYDPVNNDYLITAVTGSTSHWGTILALTPPRGFGGNDNLLFYPAQPYLDSNGITFKVAGAGEDGLGEVNIFFNDPDYSEPPFELGAGPFTVSATTTTEPSAPDVWVMLAGLAAWALGFHPMKSRRSVFSWKQSRRVNWSDGYDV